MTLTLYDSLTKRMVAIDKTCLSDETGKIGLYVCGPTVQAPPHIGHMRSAVVYDCLRRWLKHKNLPVLYIRNITDIDDKILAGALSPSPNAAHEEWWQLAHRVSDMFRNAYNALCVEPPDYEPLVTAHIPDIIAAIELLIQKNIAYQATDGSGNVFFSIAQWPEYGLLTGQRDLPAEDKTPGKRNQRDFALWKARKSTDPRLAFWQSPWGEGRPGWHIECSVMSTKYLGRRFAIHGGGIDLRFPHHENELAQSRAAGDAFADVWMHTGAVNVGNLKMSKSFGNSVLVEDVLSQTSAHALRYYFLTAHYRATLDYTPDSLAHACVTWNKLVTSLRRAAEYLDLQESDLSCAGDFKLHSSGHREVNSSAEPGVTCEMPNSQAQGISPDSDFALSLDNDFNTPEALAVVHTKIKKMNRLIDAHSELRDVKIALLEVLAMLSILCPVDYNFLTARDAGGDKESNLIKLILDKRNEAREQRDFHTSDLLRDLLVKANIDIVDTPYQKK